MSQLTDKSRSPRMAWIFWGSLNGLDAATWLETTRALREQGWRVTLIAAGAKGPRQIRGVEVFCVPRPNIYFLWQFAYHFHVLRVLVRQWSDLDIILFHQMSAPWMLPLRLTGVLTRKTRPLLVMDTRTVHMAKAETETWRQNLNGRFHSLMNFLANYFADGQTAITLRLAEAVRIRPQKFWGVWPSGSNPKQFEASRNARLWPNDNDPVALVYVGVLNYERNLITLARAVEAANAQGMKFSLTLVGEGRQRAELGVFAAGTEQRIKVLPPVPHDQIPAHLANGHVGALPFPDEEKFRVSSPIKLFEYMAAGLPILATRIVCHTDVVGDGEFAFWADDSTVDGFVAALRRIWNDRDSLAHRGVKAAEAAQSWTWEESAGKLKAALEHGIATTPTAARNARLQR